MDLETFRREKDQFMKSHPHSPLTPEQQKEFTSLNYFPENPALCFDVTLTPDPDRPIVAIETSGGAGRFYRRAGSVIVLIDGTPCQLVIYLPEQGEGYFLPFTDETTGQETYSGGRYIEPAPLPDGSLHIDFNLAYNPYCAYNDRWSCAIPPRMNKIAARIEAGEKGYAVLSTEQ